jgi:hypothetical protein
VLEAVGVPRLDTIGRAEPRIGCWPTRPTARRPTAPTCVAAASRPSIPIKVDQAAKPPQEGSRRRTTPSFDAETYKLDTFAWLPTYESATRKRSRPRINRGHRATGMAGFAWQHGRSRCDDAAWHRVNVTMRSREEGFAMRGKED